MKDMEDKEFRRFEDLRVAGDGEVILESGKHTYGYKRPSGHRVVWYKGKQYRVHILVAECFLNDGNPIDSKVYAVHHINEVKDDNRVENLIILTHEVHSKLHNTGKVLSEETKRKMSEAKKGTHQTEEHIRKRAEVHKKAIIGINKETGCTVEFDSATDAERVLGISSTGITKCCRGKRQSAGGLKWYYA